MIYHLTWCSFRQSILLLSAWSAGISKTKWLKKGLSSGGLRNTTERLSWALHTRCNKVPWYLVASRSRLSFFRDTSVLLEVLSAKDASGTISAPGLWHCFAIPLCARHYTGWQKSAAKKREDASFSTMRENESAGRESKAARMSLYRLLEKGCKLTMKRRFRTCVDTNPLGSNPRPAEQKKRCCKMRRLFRKPNRI